MISLVKSLCLVPVRKISLCLHSPLPWALRVKDVARDLLAVPWLKPKLGCQGVVGTCQAATWLRGRRGHSKVTRWLHLSV